MSDGTISTSHNPISSNKLYNELRSHFEDIQDKQGAIGSLWNDVKGITGIGTSEKKCDSMLEKYRNGEISFEQAANYVDSFDKKQSDTTDLIANIVTGVAAIATTTLAGVMGGPLLPILAIGAGVGAVTKTGFKLFDRATNKVKNDEFEAKTMIKDFVSGAVTGAASAVPSGISKGIKDGNKILAVENGIKCGLACGAVSGSTSYMTDVALGDKKFNADELFNATASSALISGVVSAGIGAGLYDIAGAKGLIGQEVTKSTTQTIASDSASSSARKICANKLRHIAA